MSVNEHIFRESYRSDVNWLDDLSYITSQNTCDVIPSMILRSLFRLKLTLITRLTGNLQIFYEVIRFQKSKGRGHSVLDFPTILVAKPSNETSFLSHKCYYVHDDTHET